LREAPHHFIGHRSIQDDYSVGAFREEALERMRSLYRTHDLLIMVGGSGMYLDAVTRGLDHFPEVEPGVRRQLTELSQREGLEPLQKMLLEKDPEYYREVDLNNPHRLIRALEVCLSSGMPYSSFRGRKRPPDFFKHLPLGITAPREVVYGRIDARVDQMMQAGLLAEARALYPYRHLNALQTVGYQELFAHFDGACDLDAAVAEIKKIRAGSPKGREPGSAKTPIFTGFRMTPP
jgi:tRNA dimethylallyltransferase